MPTAGVYWLCLVYLSSVACRLQIATEQTMQFTLVMVWGILNTLVPAQVWSDLAYLDILCVVELSGG